MLGYGVPHLTYVVNAIVNRAFGSDRTCVMGSLCLVSEMGCHRISEALYEVYTDVLGKVPGTTQWPASVMVTGNLMVS